MKRQPLLTLIIPVYNEYSRLISGLRTALSYLERQSYRWEVLLIDDGSEVPTSALIKQALERKILAKKFARLPIFVHRLPKNRGKGAAIARGIAHAQGKYILFSDIDFSVDPTYIRSFLKALTKSPIVIASRRHQKSVIAIHQPWLRENFGRIFTAFSNIILGLSVTDATCGMKGYEMRVAKRLFKMLQTHRWVFDSELLFLAKKKGITVVELPVIWRNNAATKVRAFDTIHSFLDLLSIRVRDWQGEYK